jgi:transposase
VTSSMTAATETRRILVGVDTHKHVHVAVAIDAFGVRLEDRSFPADTGGYQQLAEWAETLGRVTAFGSRAPAVMGPG